jgi:hypothetical protein
MNEPAGTPAGEGSHASLEAALAGYEQSGPAVSCVNRRDLGSNRSAGEGAIIFEGRTRSRIWVNRPAGGCPSLEFNRTLITSAPSSQLCSGDIARVVDLGSSVEHGGCALGEFTPYRRRR